MNTRFDERAVVITGAGAGIGRETALLFAGRGAKLYLCDVNDAALDETAREAGGYGNPVTTRRVDVANAEQMKAFADAVHREVAAVDVLVNNAGVALAGGFLDTTIEDWEWLIGINLWGVIYGCHYFIPKMVERKRGGHVVNVSSAAGFIATRDMAAYSTTKFGVFGLAEALRDELEEHGIGVSTICPGVINTGIVKTARLRGQRAQAGGRERIVEMYRRRNYGPEKVANAIFEAVTEKKAVVPVTPEAWAAYAMKRVLPDSTPKWIRLLMDRQTR